MKMKKGLFWTLLILLAAAVLWTAAAETAGGNEIDITNYGAEPGDGRDDSRAINAALEAPEYVGKVIADSFEGEYANKAFTEILLKDRENAKADNNARAFFEYMHGADWEQIVDNDTSAILRHSNEIGRFFHKPLSLLSADILLTGSKADPYMYGISDHYYENVYGEILRKIGHGDMYLFEQGGHPAMITCFEEFYDLSMRFLSL